MLVMASQARLGQTDLLTSVITQPNACGSSQHPTSVGETGVIGPWWRSLLPRTQFGFGCYHAIQAVFGRGVWEELKPGAPAVQG